MPTYYRKHLLPTLQERLDQFMESDDRREQLALYEEIALARVMLSESLELVSALEGQPISPDMLAAARQAVRSGLDLVADLCARMSSIEKNMSGQCSVMSLGMFVTDVGRLLYKALGDTPVVRQLVEDMRHKVRVSDDPDFDPIVRITFDGDEEEETSESAGGTEIVAAPAGSNGHPGRTGT